MSDDAAEVFPRRGLIVEFDGGAGQAVDGRGAATLAGFGVRADEADALEGPDVEVEPIGAAAEKLGEHYLPESWKKLQRQILLKLAMKVMAQVKLGFESVKALGIELDMPSLETTEALLDLALEHRKTVLDLGVGYVQDYVVAAVKDTLTPWFHQRNQALLTAALERLAKGDAPRDETGFERAKQLFTTYEAQHNALNLAHLDKDLYRLDAKLVLDTVAKGALLYVGVKEILSPATWLKLKRLDLKSLNDIQKKIVEQAELTDKVGQALDTAFDSYQGYRWIADALSAGRTLEQVTKALLP